MKASQRSLRREKSYYSFLNCTHSLRMLRVHNKCQRKQYSQHAIPGTLEHKISQQLWCMRLRRQFTVSNIVIKSKLCCNSLSFEHFCYQRTCNCILYFCKSSVIQYRSMAHLHKNNTVMSQTKKKRPLSASKSAAREDSK